MSGGRTSQLKTRTQPECGRLGIDDHTVMLIANANIAIIEIILILNILIQTCPIIPWGGVDNNSVKSDIYAL